MLSLITATHNRPSKLKDICLPSILSQSKKDFEWVIVNDGANEETREIVKSIDSSILINYIETEHQGLCRSRNRGLDEANGDYDQ